MISSNSTVIKMKLVDGLEKSGASRVCLQPLALESKMRLKLSLIAAIAPNRAKGDFSYLATHSYCGRG
jgi:hypothetical protein